MIDQVIRTEPADATGEFEEIDAIIGRARRGELAKDAALDAIGRIVRRGIDVDPAEVYQKPWG
ncbi:MAG: hypothetical protein ACK4VY_00940 [Brevundimonas sp.]